MSYSAPAIALPITPFSIPSYNTVGFLEWLFGRRPKRDDRPARTESAGRRGKCSDVSQRFVGFVPPMDAPGLEDQSIPTTAVKSAVGLTAIAFPTLWFHVPALPPDVQRLELMIQDEQNTDVIREPIAVPLAGAGIYGINWDITDVPLELNKPYHWYLSILCNSERPSRNPSIDAWVERVAVTPSIAAQIASTSEDREQIQLYMNDGIWHDALTRLATLRCQSQDEELMEDWVTLLSSIGVAEEMAIAPIRQCPTT